MTNSTSTTTRAMTRRQMLASATAAGAALAAVAVPETLALAAPAANADGWINVRPFGVRGDGQTDDAPALQKLLNAHSAGGTLHFPPGEYVLSGNISSPANICWALDGGAVLRVSEGSTLRLDGEVLAPLQPIFTGAGAVRGTLGRRVYYPQWWGAVADGQTDCAPAINAAMQAAHEAGGGTVFLRTGVYLLKTVQGPNRVFIAPRSGVALVGEGDGSVLKAADGMNAQTNGWNVIFPPESGSRWRVEDALFRDFKVDCNGTANLQTEGKIKFKNAAIGILYGVRITVENVTVENNAGRQCFTFGANVKPHSTSDIIIRNCRVHAVGGGVAGNKFQNDHSVVYLQCDRGLVQNNLFANTIPDGVGTAFEIHSSRCVMSGNVVQNFSKGINIVAAVTDQVNSIYADNIFSGVEQGAMFWAFEGMTMENVSLRNNIFEQIEGFYPIVDASVNVKAPIGEIIIAGNTFRCVQGKPENAGHGVAVGNAANTQIKNNSFENLTGRAVTLGKIGDKVNRLLIEENTIHNCCRTTKNGYHTAIELNHVSALALLSIRGNVLTRSDETAMTGAIKGNAALLRARIENNLIENIPDEVGWSDESVLGTLFVEQCGHGSPVGKVRASPGSRWTDPAAGVSWRKATGSTSSNGWISESYADAPPTEGDFQIGDRVYNSRPAPGAPSGWICVAAGHPGTFKALNEVSA